MAAVQHFDVTAILTECIRNDCFQFVVKYNNNNNSKHLNSESPAKKKKLVPHGREIKTRTVTRDEFTHNVNKLIRNKNT